MDTLLTLLGTAGVSFIMGIPGSDDVMLNYQSTSFHDSLFLRDVLGLRRAPEFEAWLQRMGLTDAAGRIATGGPVTGCCSRPCRADIGRMSEADSSARPAGRPGGCRTLAGAPRAHAGAGRARPGRRCACPPAEVLGFGHAHALARDAVHRALDLPTV